MRMGIRGRERAAASGLEWDPRRMALLSQRAENRWVGMNCGIMDQLIAAQGEPGHALLIDCRSLDSRPVPLPPGTEVVVLDTGTRRGLTGSAYNERRARHVITENARTLRAAEAMSGGDPREAGRLMDMSHASLRDDFEVSSPELDAIVEITRRLDGCYGARMTGAGFGGSAVALMREGTAGSRGPGIVDEYRRATGRDATLYPSLPAGGASVEVAGEAGRG